MCERRSPWQRSPHRCRFFSSITESLPPVWTQLMEAHLRALAQVGSAHSDHTEELQSDTCTSTGTCTVPELREDSSGQEEPCGRAALPEHRGYCQ